LETACLCSVRSRDADEPRCPGQCTAGTHLRFSRRQDLAFRAYSITRALRAAGVANSDVATWTSCDRSSRRGRWRLRLGEWAHPGSNGWLRRTTPGSWRGSAPWREPARLLSAFATLRLEATSTASSTPNACSCWSDTAAWQEQRARARPDANARGQPVSRSAAGR